MSLHQHQKNGYLIAGIGSLIGSALFIFLGTYLGMGYVRLFMPNATLDGIFPPFIGFIFGWWVGEVLGCWLALRLLEHRRAARTAKLLAMMTPVGIFFWMPFYGIVINFMAVASSLSTSLTDIRNITMAVTIAFAAVALALNARSFALQNTSKF
jgi:hypothetical protein